MDALLLAALAIDPSVIAGAVERATQGPRHEASGRGSPLLAALALDPPVIAGVVQPASPSAPRTAAPADASRVIVVGAGASGLAVAVHLHKKGIPFVLLERQDEASWRSQVRALRAHGFMFPIPKDFASGRDYLDHLLAYAGEHGIMPVFDTTVVSAEQAHHHPPGPGLWRVTVNRLGGSGNSGVEEHGLVVGRCLVVATGMAKDMRMVSRIPGLRDTFQGDVIHASEYETHGHSYDGKKVLVLGDGGGASAAATRAVSVGLIEQGARPVVVTTDDSLRNEIRSSAATSTSGLSAPTTLTDKIGSVIHCLLAWLLVLVSGNVLSTHGRALMHDKPGMELAGLLMCALLSPVDKALDAIERIGGHLSHALGTLGMTCSGRAAERVCLNEVGLLVWYILSAVEIGIRFFFFFVHCVLFALVFLAAVLGLGRCDAAPPQLNNSRQLRPTTTSFELLRLLMWYSLCLVVNVCQVIIEVLLFTLGVDDIVVPGSGINHVAFARGVTRFSESRVELADGRAVEVNVVVLATGYGTNLPQAKWPPGCNVFDNKGYPNTAFPQGWKGQSGLYSIGFTARQGLSAASWGPVQIGNHIVSQQGSHLQLGPVSVSF